MEIAQVTNLLDSVRVLTLPVSGRYIPFTLMPRETKVIEADRVQSFASVRTLVQKQALLVEAVPPAISAAPPAVKKKAKAPAKDAEPSDSDEK